MPVFRRLTHRRAAVLSVLATGGLAVVVTPGYPQDAAPAAQPAAPVPVINLLYRQLTNRQELKFKTPAAGPNKAEYSKPVGDLNFDLPPTEFTAGGLNPQNLKTFCLEPLVPIYAGTVYPFTPEPLDSPRGYGLADDEAGQKLARKKALYLRELYGRFYADTQTPDKVGVSVPAFQTAVWEISQEREVADGPMPFSLFTGTFQANYPDEAAAPAHVREAQRYMQNLTGDDAPFAQAQAAAPAAAQAAPAVVPAQGVAAPAAVSPLAGQELVRLTALPTAGGLVAQSQLALRQTPTGIAGPGGGGPGGLGLGGSGPVALGGPGGIGPVGGGGFPGGGFGGGGFPFFGGGGNNGDTNTNGSSSGPGRDSPINTNNGTNGSISGDNTTTSFNGTNNGFNNGTSNNGTNNNGTNNNGTNNNGPSGDSASGNDNGTPPVPAPPAVILAGVGAVVLLAARRNRGQAAA